MKINPSIAEVFPAVNRPDHAFTTAISRGAQSNRNTTETIYDHSSFKLTPQLFNYIHRSLKIAHGVFEILINVLDSVS